MKMVIVRVIAAGLLIASVFAILMSVVMLAGLGAGFLVNHLVPAINLGSAAIAGVLAFGVAVHCVVQFIRLTAIMPLRTEDEDSEDDEDIDPELISEKQMEAMADQVSETVMMKIGSRGKRRSASRHRR